MTVFRTFDMILVAIMICAAGVTYKVKYDAQKRIGEVRRIERQIVAEKNTINLLHAEWAMMIEPGRMQILASRYQEQLGLQVTEARQIVQLQDVPERLPDQIENLIKDNELEESNALLARNGTAGVDNFATGSVRP
ncbi:cell division protein FtsL [Bartonella sp. LJL80]